MISFRQFIEEEDVEALLAATAHMYKPDQSLRNRLKYTDPDDLWGNARQSSLTFIYKDGQLWHQMGVQHYVVAANKGIVSSNGDSDRHDLMHDGYILGRAGSPYGPTPPAKVIAFWNEVTPAVKDCVRLLLSKQLVTPDYYVTGDKSEVLLASELLSGQSGTGVVSPKFSPELLRKMHVMPSSAKKQVMAAQGYTPVGRDVMRPGQKWWAPKSEGKI